MKPDPLTDPTSLIAYRLANRDHVALEKRPSPDRTNAAPARFTGFTVLLGLLAIAISVLACI